MSLATNLTALVELIGNDVKDLLDEIASIKPYTGEIREYAGVSAPAGWSIAAGQVLNIADRPALFAVIGNMYGGDGVDTFALPDFRDRVALGASTVHSLGSVGGNSTVSLTASNLPAHTHAASLDLTGLNPSTTITVGTAAGQAPIVTNNGGLTQTFGGQSGAAIYLPANTPPTAPELLGGVNTILNGTGSVTVNDNTTSHDSVNILPPYLAINRIIYLG